jgi:hypothetical protein
MSYTTNGDHSAGSATTQSKCRTSNGTVHGPVMGMIHYIKAAGGAKLALHDLGGSGPPLLILHCNRHGCGALVERALTVFITPSYIKAFNERA